jgi:non-canonical (house-cleaning) NTP pyrophosphatase
MASSQTVVVAIGTENKAKINALRIALEKIYSGKEIVIRPAAVRC